MKKAEWQAVYAPQGDALERRVRQTLDGLADRPERAYPRRAVFVAAALVLALIAAAAVAAGLTRSADTTPSGWRIRRWRKNTALRRIWRAFSPARRRRRTGRPSSPIAPTKMWAILRGSWAITPLRFGTVRLRRVGQTTAKPVGDDFSSDVWNTALLARGIARRKAGENGMKSRARCLKRERI